MGRAKNWNFREKYSKEIPYMSYLTHGIHPYTAKLIPQLPRHFLEKYTQNDDTILDPFCGSGTTLLEAKLLGRNAIGIDINPLAVLISEVKTTPLNIDELSSAICSVKQNVKNGNGRKTVTFPNIDYWFCKKAENDLSQIKFSVENLDGKFSDGIYKFLLVCFSSIIRKSSYADPRMAKTYKSKRVIERIRTGWVPTAIQYFGNALDRKFESIKLLSEHPSSSNNCAKAFQEDARRISVTLEQSGTNEVDFIITSPPYINAQDYFRSYKLELWWLGLATPKEVRCLNKQVIGSENVSGSNYNSIPKTEYRLLNTILNKIWKIKKKKSYIVYNYFENMRHILKECRKALKMGGHFCLITGSNTICGTQIPIYKILTHMAENNGFELVELGTDEIKNRALPPGRNHKGGIIKEEWITVFRKRDG